MMKVVIRPVNNGYVVKVDWDRAGCEEMIFTDATEAIEWALKQLTGDPE